MTDGFDIDTDTFTWTVADVVGPNMALDFDGTNDHVTFGPAPSLGLTTFTLEAWIRRDAAGVTTSTGSGGVTGTPIIAKGRSESDGSTVDANYFLGIDANNHLVADFEDLNTGLNHPVVGAISIPISATTWHHVAVTYDVATGVWRLYVDGVADTTTTVTGTVNVRTPRSDSIQHAGIGTAMNSTGATSGFWNGVVDEARIWSVVRTQAQIQSTMSQELTTGTGLIARWGLIEGAGAAVGNSVAGGVNGTAVGGPAWVPGFPLPAPNQPPVFSTDIVDQFDDEGDVVSLDANASDADLDTLTYSATGLPGGVSIDPGTGVISGTLSTSSSGVHAITITVSDGTDTDTDTFLWSVTNTNQAPVFSTDIADQSDTEGDTVSLDADASDGDLQTLTYSRHRPARRRLDRQRHGCHQRHPVRHELGCPQRHDHRDRRHRQRYRHVHLDRGQPEPGTRLQRPTSATSPTPRATACRSTPTRPMPTSTR